MTTKRKEVPPLIEGNTLIRIKVRSWTGQAKDNKASNMLAETAATTTNWVWGNVKIVDPAVLAEIKTIKGAVTNYLRGASPSPVDGSYLVGGLYDWDNGWRLLPNALSEKVYRALGEFLSQFEVEVEKIRKALPDALARARAENPNLAKDVDVDEIIESKFEFDIKRSIITNTQDIRVQGSKAFIDAVKADVQKAQADKLSDIQTHCANTVVDVARHLAKSCANYDPDNKGKAPFRDSTIEKARDLVAIIPTLNISNDARIDKAVSDLVGIIGNKSGAELRSDDDTRKTVGEEASKLADNIDSLFN